MAGYRVYFTANTTGYMDVRRMNSEGAASDVSIQILLALTHMASELDIDVDIEEIYTEGGTLVPEEKWERYKSTTNNQPRVRRKRKAKR